MGVLRTLTKSHGSFGLLYTGGFGDFDEVTWFLWARYCDQRVK